MTIQALRSQFLDYAKDIKINLGNVLTTEGSPGLSNTQIYATALACAYATKNEIVVQAIYEDAKGILSNADINAAKAATSIMAMNNIYYRFVHLSSDKSFQKMNPSLRMNIINNSGVEKTDFELYALAVSAINGCGMCIDAHVKVLQKAGISNEAIQSAIKIASVIFAAAQVQFIH